jgi:anaerobic selenocysteine-containing dehydrogenase
MGFGVFFNHAMISSEPSGIVSKVRGYCALCTAHCATIATVENGRVTRLDPDPEHPNGGVLCLKGKAAPDLVYHPDRLDYPLRRTRPKDDPNPGWERISWDEALDGIAQRLLEIRERFGARAIALAKGTASGTSVDDAQRWLNRFMNAFGSPNSISTIHVCNWHKDTGLHYTFGVELPLPDLAHSNAFLLWGHNPSSTSLILATGIVAARARGMKLVAVDPRRVGLPGQADILLQVRPGADGALALAFVHAFIEEGWYDAGFVRHWTNGPFLVRRDTGRALTEADLTSSGRSDRYVVWDEKTNKPAIYDPASVSFERDDLSPSLFGEKRLRGKENEVILCLPAFQSLAELASRYTPERSEATTWVPAKKVWQAAHLLAHNRPVSMYVWNGVGQHTNATQANRAIALLYALLGDFDGRGGNVIFPHVPTNAVDGKEFLSNKNARERLGLAERPLGPPAKPGNCTAYDVFTAILEGRPYPVRALLNFGSNTVMSTGDSRRAREAFLALDLAVAVELFMTPTAELCDYVLPAASFLEMANLKAGFRHRSQAKAHLQYRPAVIPPLAERRSDTWIIFELAKRLGLGDCFWNGDIEAAYNYELARTGVTLEQTKASSGGITIPQTLRYQKYADKKDSGAPHGFATPSGKVELYSHAFAAHGYSALPEYIEPAMSPLSRPDVAAEYPLILTTAKFTTFIHSQLRSLPRLRKASPEPAAELHPETAARYGIKHKAWMFIETPKGSNRVRARVTDRIIPEVVCCEHGWWQPCKELKLPGYDPYRDNGANSSVLIGCDLADPISGSLPHRSYLCRIRPAE